jgi:hypothetical protein
VPRDATGYPLGAGRTVAFDVGSSSGIPAVDRGDGSYGVTVTASPTPDTIVVRATVDGSDLGREVEVRSGFDLLEVVTAVGREAEDLAVTPGLKQSVVKKLVRAAGKLATAASVLAVVEDGEDEALKYAFQAARNLRKADRKSKGAIDLGPALFELATAAREVAREAVEGAPPDGGKRLEQALSRLEAGDAAMGAGKYDRAIRLYRNALRKAVSP